MSSTDDAEVLTASLGKTIDDYLAKDRNTAFLLDLEINAKYEWKEGDRIWFLNNPNRTYRLRRVAPGELSGEPWNTTHVIVRQVEVDLRENLFISDKTNGKHLDSAPDVEEYVSALWQAMDNGGIGPTILVRDTYPRASRGHKV